MSVSIEISSEFRILPALQGHPRAIGLLSRATRKTENGERENSQSVSGSTIDFRLENFTRSVAQASMMPANHTANARQME
jgi:hypothetical protein